MKLEFQYSNFGFRMQQSNWISKSSYCMEIKLII
ncbi:hypothetical protein Csa_023623 [Cucumis sativus]|nr:hypothetical protein Csa_023623 [Cucumis sativus]